jgi:anthranilate/para-aminobenzoate synthase component I
MLIVNTRCFLQTDRRHYTGGDAGIVADSEPAREYQETLIKAQSMLSALQIADAWVTPL